MPALTTLIDGIIDAIGGGANAATLRSKLLSLKEQTEAFEAAHAYLLNENTALEKKYADLQSQVSQPKHPVSEAKGTDKCPYCNKVSGVLQDIKPDPIWGGIGTKIYDYKCSNCGKTYDKQVES